jgi:photosystem II stability/assembly factor-like uncharacterized protein
MKNKEIKSIRQFYLFHCCLWITILSMVMTAGLLWCKIGKVTITDINPDQSSRDATAAWGCASGGRVNGLAVDPNNNLIQYAATEWGGLYKSTNGGRNWTHLDGHVPQAMWDVEVDPSNSNRVYATSFYDGRVNSIAGINVSTNGGKTWTHPATATPSAIFCTDLNRRTQPSAFGICIDPDNNQNVYIGTNSGLAISTDSGVTWTFVDPTPATGPTNVYDVVVHHNGIIDLFGQDGHRRRTPGNTNWTTVTAGPGLPGGWGKIAASPNESYVLFVVVGSRVYESDNGGSSWPHTFILPNNNGRFPFVRTNDRAGNTFDLWTGDVVVWRATCTTPATPAQGGAARCSAVATWTAANNGAHNDVGDVVFATAALDACPLLYCCDGGVYFNTVGTNPACHTPVWEQPTVTPHALWIFDLDGAHQTGKDSEDLYFACQDNGTFACINASSSSPTWANRNYGDAFDVCANSSRVLYTQGAPWHLYLANPNMVSGTNITGYPGNFIKFQNLKSIDTFGDDDFVMVTSTGVHITQNITASPIVWTELGDASCPNNACAVLASVQNGIPTFIIKAGGGDGNRGGSLWRYKGTGTNGTWHQISRNGSSSFGVYAVDPKRPNRIFASDLAPVAGPQMVITEDGGTTWQTMAALDNLMTGNGIFRYNNHLGINNWRSISGYPQPTLVAFDPEDPEILIAGGADSGIFISIDQGKNWELVTDPISPRTSGIPHISRPRHAYFDHEPGKDDVNIYVGSQGRGVWRLSFKKDPLAAVKGKISFLRVHAPGSKYGGDPDVLDADVIVRLQSHPKIAMGFKLRPGQDEASAQGMLDLLRDAFTNDETVQIEYEKMGLNIGRIIRVIKI